MIDNNDKPTKKAFNFDLDTNALKEHYPKKHYNQAYDDIRKFMFENSFSYRKCSIYILIEIENQS